MYKKLTIAFAIAGWIFVVVMILAIIQILCVDVYLGSEMKIAFGFEIATPYSQERGEVLMIKSVKSDGVLYKAGVRQGDVIEGMSSTNFYQTLDRARNGETVSFQVAPWLKGKEVTVDAWRPIRITPQILER